MAFDATVIVLNTAYTEKLHDQVIMATNSTLKQYNMKIESTVDFVEYREHTSSREINQYIRVPKKILDEQKEQAYELIKVGTGRYECFEQFASVKYAFISVSGMNNVTVIWHSFHSKLARVFPEFSNLPYLIVKQLSKQIQTECMLLKATTFSRNDDVFMLYYNNKLRNSLSSKGALTTVKEQYHIDINAVMENIDLNLSLFYAPTDFVLVKKQIKDQYARYAKFKQHAESVTVEDKQTGENMMERFKKENEMILADLERELVRTETAIKTNPIGEVIFIKINDNGGVHQKIDINETNFGRSITPSS